MFFPWAVVDGGTLIFRNRAADNAGVIPFPTV